MRLFLPIAKVDAEQRMVYGYASTEAKDDQDEIVTKSALDAALGDYMKFANIREMHQLSAVGTAKEAAIDDKGLYVAAKIIDPLAWEKVRSGVYKGFSIGGRVLERNPSDPATITALALNEISLVDRPANPEAVFDCWKRSAGLAAAEAAIAGIVKALGAAETAMAKGGDAPGDGAKPYGDEDYADPGYQSDGKKRYPLTEGGKPSETRIRAAWNYIHKKKNAGKYSAEHLAAIKKKIVAAWKAHIDKDGPPAADAGMKAAGAQLRKTLNDAGRVAHIAQDLKWVRDCVAMEAAMENDDSSQAAKLLPLIAALVEWCQAELSEALDEIRDGTERDGTLVVTLAAVADGLAKGADIEAHLAALRKAGGGEDGPANTHSTVNTAGNAGHAAPQAKAPAGPADPEANSTVDTEHGARVQAIHDHAAAMGAKCAPGMAMAAGAGDLAKVQAERDKFAATLCDLAPRVEALGKRVEELAQQPLPAETIARGLGLRRVEKGAGADAAPRTPEEVAQAFGRLSSEDQTMVLIRASHMQPKMIPGLSDGPMPARGGRNG